MSRLDYISEFPEGDVVCFFDFSDVFKVKEILGNRFCLGTSLPASMFQVGTPQEIKENTERVIDEVGGGGGLVLSTENVKDDANPRLVESYIECIKDHGSC